MSILEIASPVTGFGKRAGFMSDREALIDFDHDPLNAKFCTAAFCAAELEAYLSKTDPELTIRFVDAPTGKNQAIVLDCASDVGSDGGYRVKIKGKVMTILGNDRNGMVNGTYGFLKEQGWRWLEPGKDGEFAPKPHKITFPGKSFTVTPSFRYRALYFEFPSQASIDFLFWMARNQMNVFGSFPELKAKAQMLGMYLLSGGHIVTDMLKPKRRMESGKYLYEEHPDWYGTPEAPAKKTIDTAQHTQFCCSNESLMDFITDNLVDQLNGRWSKTDILEVSGFDTWGSSCQCPKCRKLADSDKYLKFMNAIRIRLNRAFADGRLKKNPMLNTWAYEGTATMNPPEKGIPAAMTKAHDNCIAFVIQRCTRHTIGAPDCKMNAGYAKVFKGWGKFADKLTLWGGEYYNVSRHEDMPLVFVKNMTESMRFYYENGARGITYMHTPIINWGMRAITQNLHAALGWDITLDTEKYRRDYLKLRYGKHAAQIAKAYDALEQATADIADWRSWIVSVMENLFHYAAGQKMKTIASRHFKDDAAVIRSGKNMIRLMQRAEQIFRKAWLEELDNAPAPTAAKAVNPEEAARLRRTNALRNALDCDLRLTLYGIDIMTMMTLCATYASAEIKGDTALMHRIWAEMEPLAQKMELTCESVSYRINVPFFETRTTLDRSQMGRFVDYCRNREKELSAKSKTKKK